jgi:hypothetical protein
LVIVITIRVGDAARRDTVHVADVVSACSSVTGDIVTVRIDVATARNGDQRALVVDAAIGRADISVSTVVVRETTIRDVGMDAFIFGGIACIMGAGILIIAVTVTEATTRHPECQAHVCWYPAHANGTIIFIGAVAVFITTFIRYIDLHAGVVNALFVHARVVDKAIRRCDAAFWDDVVCAAVRAIANIVCA